MRGAFPLLAPAFPIQSLPVIMRRLLATFLFAAITVVVGEGMMWLLNGPPSPPVKVFGVRGESDAYLSSTDHQVQPAYQRVDPIPPFDARAPGVAVIGGSSVHGGSGAPLVRADEFSSLLAQRLGHPVHNLGAAGMDSFDLVSLVEELSAVSLDLLIVYAGHSDLENALLQQRFGDMVGAFSTHTLPVLERLHGFSLLRRWLWPPSGTEAPAQPERIRRDQSLRLSASQRVLATRYFATNIARIVWLCQQRSLPLILVVPASDLLAEPARDHCRDGEDCAKGLWFRGIKALNNFRPQEGLGVLQQARDRDPISARASSDIEAAVRSFHHQPGVSLVDAALDLPRMEANFVPDRELFTDANHFSATGHVEMANLLEAPVRQLLMPSP